MNRDGRSSSNDPTAEPAAAQSTQTASGLSSGRPGAGPADTSDSEDDEQVVNRTRQSTTPRRYEQPVDADEDPPPR